MASTAVMQQRGSVSRSGGSGGLYEVLDLILDKGLVVDVFVRVSLVGIELITIDARIVIASVDTYLRFAEAVNRLDLTAGEQGGKGLPDLVDGAMENGSRSKTKGVLDGAKESLFGSDDSDDRDDGHDGDRDERDRRAAKRRAAGREEARA